MVGAADSVRRCCCEFVLDGWCSRVCRCCCEFVLDGWCSRECV